jgi:hypothetical protein
LGDPGDVLLVAVLGTLKDAAGRPDHDASPLWEVGFHVESRVAGSKRPFRMVDAEVT